MLKRAARPADVEFRLRNLLSAFHRVLPSLQLAGLSSRVREIPNERTLRFYATAGLLAPPLRFNGRRAVYGRSHLLQLLAIKRLQSQGYPIRNIQEILRKVSHAKLLSIADVDSDALDKAIANALRDPSLNLQPRPAGDRLAPAAPIAAATTDAVRSHRIARGMYLIVDSSSPDTRTPQQVRRCLKSFLDSFPGV